MIRLRKPVKPSSPPAAADEPEWTTVLGIDTSTTRMGIVVLRGAKGRVPEVLLAMSSSHTDLQSHNRQRAQTNDVIDVLNRYRPDVVVIEAPFTAGPGRGHSDRKTLGQAAVVRYVVIQYGYDYRETSPSELKRYVTGSGAAKKPQVKAAVMKRWGFDAKNHDIADAYGLGHIGLACVGLVGRLEQHEAEIVGNLKIERAGG